MYVRRKMTANPYTISYDASINEAIELMREKNIKRIPVVNGDKVVGMLTHVDIQTLSSPKATTLSVFELNYLLSKAKVGDAMTKEVITISPDALLEEAAVLMRENRISSLVVMENNRLVGIITESDIFDAFIDLLGFRDKGSRITVEAADVPGAVETIGGIFNSFNANITHIAVYRGSGGKSDVVIRTNMLNTDEIEKKLEENGYKVVHKIKSEA
ncbi:MAG TPA: CBS and ACT domain-containing protein [Peptococcaceae bacterium]|jgi:acetoin utilization protein AcuB|nr:CBS domain-containing protein [Clostridia bacterium]HOB81604.1 CBS and ACT domain-containing protein [Peptococcaceae bacterium]HPZ71646.1 CBS and ACT domain-containing protein [Peptococcaceae bacterium]HQD53916.1 CBS and ACT domain-containing protein [Peptococcaceae bacterium]